MKRPRSRIVAEVTPDVMDGDTALLRALNAYMTKNYIMSRDIPADECLSEAKEIVEMSNTTPPHQLADRIEKYLIGQFMTSIPMGGGEAKVFGSPERLAGCRSAAIDIISLLGILHEN